MQQAVKSNIKGIDYKQVPQHVAVIMDGNGRWAEQQGKARSYGHSSALTAIIEVVKASLTVGVQHITLYAFSTENWQRPTEEVTNILQVMLYALREYSDLLVQNGTRVQYLGDLSTFDPSVQQQLHTLAKNTEHNTRLRLFIALNYSGKWELSQAAQRIAQEAVAGRVLCEDIDEKMIARRLIYPEVPYPELLIRTSGEMRISNFLLWQLAYTELYITKVLWPDFKRKHFYTAIKAYQRRERRFGEVCKASSLTASA